MKEIESTSDEEMKAEQFTEKAGPVLQPIWSYFVALCHTLQRGENDYLTASDAYWMGLIDEVIGDEDLKPIRHIYEDEPDPPSEQAVTE